MLFAGFLAVAVCLLVAGGYMIWNQGDPMAPGAGLASSNAPSSTAFPPEEPPSYAPLTPREPARAEPETALPAPRPAVPIPAPVPPPVAAANPVETNWEEQIHFLLESELDDTNIAFRLMALLPLMPAEQKLEAAEHMVNLMPDESYESVTPLLTNAATDPGVLDILISDLLLRPESVQLPLFLRMARTPGHPGRGDAVDYLELYLGEDYGQDWNAWNAAIGRWLENNP